MIDEAFELEAEEYTGTRNLRGINPGMPVFDLGGVLLGTVAYIYEAMEPALWRITDTLADVKTPVEVVARIQLEGCVVVDSGMFDTGYYYVLPDQIKEVAAGIFLNCYRSDLLKV